MGRRERKHAIAFGPAIVSILVVLAVMTPRQAAAESLVGSLFRFLGAAPRDDRYQPFAYAAPSERLPDQASPLPGAPSLAPGSYGSATYCVRLCDGRFFPLSGAAASSQASAAKMCASLCPASRTGVFRGDSIDNAAAVNGDRYASLANAYVYRERLVDGCTCNGKNAFGLASIDVAADPTLRAGDAVATAEGIKVFRGAGGERHRAADFTPVKTGKVSGDLRNRLATIKVAVP